MHSGHAMESVSGYISISSILIQNLTLYQNESYFPRSLDYSILWVFWVWSLWSQSSSYKTCGNWPSNGTSLFLRTSTRWIVFRTQISNLNQLKIPRCIKFNVHQPIVEVHGFCDASQRAFGACMYLRTKLGLNDYHSKLLCSKSRVAPLKTVSLPWLELSAALLLARLINKVESLWNSRNVLIYGSDSTIALNWIISPSRRSVFVYYK